MRPRLSHELGVLRVRHRLLHSTSCVAAGVSRSATVAVRAEDPTRIWERRTPLTPQDANKLVRSGARVLVQPSEKRVFADQLYTLAGAELSNSLEEAGIILGVKEIPPMELVGDTTYAFFAHVHKGQKHNIPLLASMIASGSRYIDWELLTDEAGVRTTAFGWHAGFSGLCDGFSLLGTKALCAAGAATPFIQLPRPFMHSSLNALRTSLRQVGEDIVKNGTPKSLGPITVAILGKGRVGHGAVAVLDELPTTWVSVAEMRKIVESSHPNLNTIYACQVLPEDYLSNLDGSLYDREQYYRRPQDFVSTFHENVAPWTTMVLNGAYFTPGCPPIITTEQLAALKKSCSSNRMLSIVDVSCDFGGGLPFVTAATTIDDPVFQFDPATATSHRNAATPGTVQISSIEILPSSIPLDSSIYFSASVLPYLSSLVDDPTSSSNSPIAQALRRATTVEGGRLTAKYTGLYELLEKGHVKSNTRSNMKRKRALVLGSGLVAAPAVKALATRPDIDIVVASNSMDSALALARPHAMVSAEFLDVGDRVKLEELVAEADVVLSLLPAPLHVDVARLCIKAGTSLVTASYTSTAMRELSDEAMAANIVLLNELGLDPGIDHCSAMRLIDEAQLSGNKIASFVSFCGGLPSPEDSNGPMGYKFSWSPRGVFTATLNDAHFRINSQKVDIPGPDLLRLSFPDVPIIRGFKFEGIANRDSIAYLEEYGLPSDLPTILRGTLRYPGFATVVDVFKRMGLLSELPIQESLNRWQDFVEICLRHIQLLDNGGTPEEVVARLADGDPVTTALVLGTLSELGLIGCTTPRPTTCELPPIPTTSVSPLDLLSLNLGHQLRYGPDERDIVILHHELGTVDVNSNAELFTSTLVLYGSPQGDSAMATTVGLPVALGALLCLDGRITQRGLVSPSHRDVWIPMLEQLKLHGVNLLERRTRGKGVLEQLEHQLKRQRD